MITPETIEKVRDVSLLDVVNRYPDIKLKKSGDAYKGFSPWTSEKSASFFVHPGKNIFKDFSSGKGGNNAISFVMQKETVEYLEAVKIIAGWENISIEYDKSAPKQEAGNKVDIHAALAWACSHYGANVIPETFTKGRALPDESLQAFQIGYALPSWDDLLNTATKAGHSAEILLQAGLIRKREKSEGHYDYFRDRIMFPVFDFRGNVVAFTGRNAETQALKEGQEKPAKYINSPDTCWDKGKHLYGLYQAIKGGMLKDSAYLVEGPTDVHRLHLHGLTATVSPCGSAFTDDQAKLLKRFSDKLTMVPDNDADKPENPGLKALERNAEVAIKAGFTVKVLIPGI